MSKVFGRYAAIIATVVVFLTLVLGVLGLNFYTSFQTEVTAEAVNIAGRQRMLSQRTAKSLSNLNYKFYTQDDLSIDTAELKAASALFDRSLKAFTNGGETNSTKGGAAFLEQVTSDRGREILSQANELWGPFYDRLSTMVDLAERSSLPISGQRQLSGLIADNVSYANSNINQILKLMNDLTNYQEGQATASADTSRLIQTLGIIASLVCFAIILFLIFGQLQRADRKALLAQRETRKIFETVDQGLFLIDRDFNMGSQQSKELERIFSSGSLAGKNLHTFISDIVSSTDLEKVLRYVRLLFDPHKKQKLLQDLNPLKKLPIQVQDQGELTSKYLRFSFSRVENNGKIEGVLASVSDISNEIRLENELIEETKRNEKQLEMISVLLSADANMLPEFIKSSDRTYEKINQIFRNPARNSSEFKIKADSVLTLVHATKGESSLLGLTIISETCHEIEDKIDQLKLKNDIGGDDFLSLTILLDRLISTNDQMKSVMSAVAGHSQSPHTIDSGETRNLIKLATDVSRRQHKEVVFSTGGFDMPHLAPDLRKNILSLASQLVRNAISHGIESSDIRKTLGKSEQGSVKLCLLQENSGKLILSCEDDGAGINFESIKLEASKNGLIKAEDIDHVSSKQLLQLMLKNRLSTRAAADADAGRGAGLSVLGSISDQLGARVSLQTRQGVGAKFIISIPKTASEMATKKLTEASYA